MKDPDGTMGQPQWIDLTRVFGGRAYIAKQEQPSPNGNGHHVEGVDEEDRSLEGQLRHLNAQLITINEKISNLVCERDRIEVHMRHVAREIHRRHAAAVKQDYLEGKRV